ncbi:diguanylate cyclase [Cryobacterium sp. PH31-L1]|uniref:diguanylate cyclase domain-containing protein n=1 Tax=Cryobacterium sp. PH31-L1 TaxID=3046199 RepID=UPI0024BBA017|nr:diguanylate cyclase [Cryobacterium sp. PH31-L1]MDJ0375987.1 diguanylate cyclase [Cryobacterium sp. PH31-L1]
MTEHGSFRAPGPGDAEFETPAELYDQAPCGLLSTTPDGIVTEVNATLLRWTGHSRASMLGTPFEQLLTTGSRLFYETRYLPILRLAGEVREAALTLRCVSGESLPVLVNSTTRFGTDATPRLVSTAIFDSTQRHNLERELLNARRAAEASETHVRALQDASTAFGTCESEAAVAAALEHSARQAFRATAVAVLLFDGAGGVRLAAGRHPLFDGSAGIAQGGPEAEALSNGRAVTVVNGADAEARFPDVVGALRAARIEGLSTVPIIGMERTLGLLTCFYGRQRDLDDDRLALQMALALQAAQVFERVSLHAELANLALYDSLTGLANRSLLQHSLNAALLLAARHRSRLAVIFMDLDGFKAVNDGLGHLAGDAVLEEIAHRLRDVVRGSDTLARFGGDEFVVICEDIGVDEARGLAERIRLAVRQPLVGISASFAVTASVGIALHEPVDGSAMSTAEILKAADSAMYASKCAGRDHITVASV